MKIVMSTAQSRLAGIVISARSMVGVSLNTLRGAEETESASAQNHTERGLRGCSTILYLQNIRSLEKSISTFSNDCL